MSAHKPPPQDGDAAPGGSAGRVLDFQPLTAAHDRNTKKANAADPATPSHAAQPTPAEPDHLPEGTEGTEGNELPAAPSPPSLEAPAPSTVESAELCGPRTVPQPPLFAAAEPVTPRDHGQRLMRAGWWVIAGAVLPMAAWMGFAPLSMAVVAPAFVKVDLNRRPVQHLEGGIVREVKVRDGQRVNAGDTVLVLGDVGVDADRNRLSYRVQAENATRTRLEAEQMMSGALAFSHELLAAARADTRIQQVLNKERALFNARRHSLVSEQALMRAQRSRVEQEIAALRAQIKQGEAALGLQHQDLDANRGLLGDGFISPTRVNQIEATVVDYGARLEERRSELARAEQKLVDSDLRIQSIQNEYVRAASDELKQTGARVAEVEQELRKWQDAATRQVVVAPVAGEVMDLKFTSPGAVVRAGEPIADIVPSNAQLTIEAQLRPEDINNVQLNQRARVKFTSFKYRNAVLVDATVTYVSADRLIDKATNLPYYSATIVADAQALASAGELKLQAGMPAEVYIEGSKQTALQYLLEPLTAVARKARRQM